jgi:hypothetical protein
VPRWQSVLRQHSERGIIGMQWCALRKEMLSNRRALRYRGRLLHGPLQDTVPGPRLLPGLTYCLPRKITSRAMTFPVGFSELVILQVPVDLFSGTTVYVAPFPVGDATYFARALQACL